MRINKLEINNFRAFSGKNLIDLENAGKNLLLYGENGSGKSSIFYALKYIFESSEEEIDLKSLENIFIGSTGLNKFVEVHFSDLTIKKLDSSIDNSNDTFLSESNKIKVFLNYKKLLKTYINTENRIDIFDLIVQNILSKFTNRFSGNTFIEDWRILNRLLKELQRKKSNNSKNQVRNKISNQLSLFNNGILAFLQFKSKVNEIIKYFNCDMKVKFKFKDIKLSKNENYFENTNIFVDIEFFDKRLNKAHMFLNEARLTALAISIYLGSILNAPISNNIYKILCLDDIFIGLDMSNRLPFFEILKDHFSEYQIFLLTYDRQWFEIAKRYFTINELNKWTFYELYSVRSKKLQKPLILKAENNLAKAIKFLHNEENPDYPASANYFRKHFEELVSNLLPSFENRDKEYENIEGYKLTILANKTENFIRKTKNTDKYIKELLTFLPTVIHPLSHHQISSSIYKVELLKIESALLNLEEQLNSIKDKYDCVLEQNFNIRLKFNINTNDHRIYELKLQENLLKQKIDNNLCLSKCKKIKMFRENNGTTIQTSNFRTIEQTIYDSIEQAYHQIYLDLQLGQISVDYIDYVEIQYVDPTTNSISWKPLRERLI